MSTVHGNLSHAMRDNYNEHGVDEYYRKVAATYRNPFFPGIKKVIWTFMNRWWEAEGRSLFVSEIRQNGLRVLDMAAGSGEATLCLLEWAQKGKNPVSSNNFTQPSSSSNPALSNRSTVPDPLAALRAISSAGASATSRPAFIPPTVRRPAVGGKKGKQVFGRMDPPQLPDHFELDIIATDPYTSPAYTDRTSSPCHPLSFNDLANGLVPPNPGASSPPNAEPVWDMIICSFALHLVTSPSELFALLFELSNKARWLIVVAPHKKPEIKETWGWSRYDIASWTVAGESKLYGGGGKGYTDEDNEEETELEIIRDKVKLRLYRSNAF
ncbi:uncharacterized protein IL334_007167 [Kwoniella shivajii]|uniref:Methyltransferase domain-containing protein n=1 Tax=Kwoniella shivajii TaxID=564305 RepID=A0ABZ1D8E9_9TREE|nr:hypothetical protein IL334_007167 [Kwoniella shivajii]